MHRSPRARRVGRLLGSAVVGGVLVAVATMGSAHADPLDEGATLDLGGTTSVNTFDITTVNTFNNAQVNTFSISQVNTFQTSRVNTFAATR